jgi:zinc D-Ala-D-Ala carboxypeptidase
MGDLSKNFSKSEFACPCGKCVLHIEPRLVEALQKLRDLADSPIKITSGYRCVSHNRQVGGSPNSQHIKGIAADIVIQDNTVEEMAMLAAQIPWFRSGGIGVYPQNGFIHVDVRQGVARWGFIDGKQVAFSKALDWKKKV